MALVPFDTWYRTAAGVSPYDRRPLYFDDDPEISLIRTGLTGAGALYGDLVNTGIIPNKNPAETWQNYAIRISSKNMATNNTTAPKPLTTDNKISNLQSGLDSLSGLVNTLASGFSTIKGNVVDASRTLTSNPATTASATQAKGIPTQYLLIGAAVLLLFIFRKKLL